MRGLGVQLRHFLLSALRGMRASPVTTGVATLTLAVALMLVGSFAVVLRNMEGLLDRFGRDLTITVYLEEGLDDAALESLAGRLVALPGVENAAFVSKQDALTRFRAGIGERLPLLDTLDANPLPASFELTLDERNRSAAGMRGVAGEAAALPGIEDLGYGLEWVEGYARAVIFTRNLGLAIGSVLLLATLLIVANTIRLAVYARRDEIEILSLVGASRTFVAIPFLLEGVLQGLLAAALALALLYVGFLAATPAFAGAIELVLGHTDPVFFSLRECAALLGGGALLGLLGSLSASFRGWAR